MVEINLLDANTAGGVDDVSLKVVKAIAHYIVKPTPFPHSMLERTICPNSLQIGAFTVCKQH